MTPQRGRGELRRRAEDQRGLAYPSSLVILSIIALAMAAVAFVATRHQPPTEREVAITARATPSAAPTLQAAPDPTPKAPALDRSRVLVEVYNNSGVQGLAGQVAAKASSIGWQVVGADNWYGTIPASTVYYPPRLRSQARQLALDLGINRTMPAVDPMRRDRLTVVLNAPLG